MEVTHRVSENWAGMFDKFYKKLIPNTTKMNHVFSYSRKDLDHIETQRIINSTKNVQFLIKSRKKTPWTLEQHNNRIIKVCEEVREILPHEGIKDIKAVELSTKYWPLIPDDKKEEFVKMVPPPSQNVLSKVREGKTRNRGKRLRVKGLQILKIVWRLDKRQEVLYQHQLLLTLCL